MKSRTSKNTKVTRKLKLVIAVDAQFWQKGALGLCVALCVLGLCLSGNAQGPTFATFDAPGAGTGPGQGTFASAIGPTGAITGDYIDANNVCHGFLRAPGGTIRTFDAPGAGTGGGQGTIPGSINLVGEITGFYIDVNFVSHGFLRTPYGMFRTFDVSGAGTAGGQGTFAKNINPAGGRSLGTTLTPGMYVTASCEPQTVPSRRSTLRVRVLAAARARGPQASMASTRRGRSREPLLTRAICVMATSALLTAPSRRSMFQAP